MECSELSHPISVWNLCQGLNHHRSWLSLLQLLWFLLKDEVKKIIKLVPWRRLFSCCFLFVFVFVCVFFFKYCTFLVYEFQLVLSFLSVGVVTVLLLWLFKFSVTDLYNIWNQGVLYACFIYSISDNYSFFLENHGNIYVIP